MWTVKQERVLNNEFPTLSGHYVLKFLTDEKGEHASLSDAFKFAEQQDPKMFEEILTLKKRILVEINQTVSENGVVEIANALNILDQKSRNLRLKRLQDAAVYDQNLMAGAYAMRPYTGLLIKKDKEGKLPFVAPGEFPMLWSTITVDCRGVDIDKSLMCLASVVGRDDVRFVSLIVDKNLEDLKEISKSGGAAGILVNHIEQHPGTTYASSSDVDANKNLDYVCF